MIAVNESLRPITPDDLEFLYRVYASTREEELAQTGWNDKEKEAFLRMQFDLQHRFYQENYPGATFDVILIDGIPAGRLYVHRRKNEIRIMDIALLPEYRRKGVGTRLLSGIMAEGRKDGHPVTIHVEKFNPALHLYQKLGFSLSEDKGVYLLLEWKTSGQI